MNWEQGKKETETRKTLVEIKTFIAEMNVSIELNSKIKEVSQQIEQDKERRESQRINARSPTPSL